LGTFASLAASGGYDWRLLLDRRFVDVRGVRERPLVEPLLLPRRDDDSPRPRVCRALPD
jgi:hypothetical protein